MRRVAQFVLFVLLFARLAAGASDKIEYLLLSYKGHRLTGRITAENVFTTCGKLKIDIQKIRDQYPEMHLEKTMPCQGMSLNSVGPEADAAEERAKEADRKELEEMLADYKDDHAEDQQ